MQRRQKCLNLWKMHSLTISTQRNFWGRMEYNIAIFLNVTMSLTIIGPCSLWTTMLSNVGRFWVLLVIWLIEWQFIYRQILYFHEKENIFLGRSFPQFSKWILQLKSRIRQHSFNSNIGVVQSKCFVSYQISLLVPVWLRDHVVKCSSKNVLYQCVSTMASPLHNIRVHQSYE